MKALHAFVGGLCLAAAWERSLAQTPMSVASTGSRAVDALSGEEWTPMTPPPDYLLDLATLAQQERDRRIAFHTAIATNDKRTFCRLLNEGLDPNSELPSPPPAEFVALFTQQPEIRYYVATEPGFTPLMLASALGNEVFVKILLLAGAEPHRVTRRHRTFALWLAAKQGHLEVMRLLMKIPENDPRRRLRLEVNLLSQRATLYDNERRILETAISSGRDSHPTPPGKYLVTNKYKMWKSSLYHAKMPFFMRLSCGDFGFHAGYLPGYPASHGCIRLPSETARELFTLVPEGTLVVIQ